MTFTEYLCKAHNLDYQKEFKDYKGLIEEVDLKGAMMSAALLNFNTTEAEITGKTRKREIVYQRHIMMHLIHSTNKYSLKAVGKMFGNRDHSITLYATEKVLNFLSYQDSLFMPYYHVIKEAFDEANKVVIK
jgi:chromosomal replication initiation ATPase DnaA